MSKLQKYHLVEDRPTRIQRFVDSLRSYWLGQWSSNSHDFGPFWGRGAVSSGVVVNESTALNYSAVWAAVTLISSQIGNLPLVLYKKDGKGKTRYEGHPLYRLIHDRPNPEMTSFALREVLQAHVLTWGNNYAEIERNGSGRPSALWPITPDRVTPFRRSADRPLQYRVQQPDGGEVIIDAGDMLHIPGLGYDGTCGYSVISKARESFGLGIATERFGSTFFGNGATFGGVISYPGQRPTELADKNYREALEQKHQGPERAHKLLALYNGAKYERMGIPPNDAQFLETRTFQIDEVARWFNLPPHKLKELARSTNNNIEQQNLEYYIDCLAPWLKRWEQELNEKLISPLERNTQEIEFVADGLLRGDTAGRGVFYREQFNTASITPNDIRELENRNAVDGGDEPFVNTAMIPLGLSKDWWQAQIDEKRANIEKLKQPPPPPVAPPPPGDLVPKRDLDAARKKAQECEDLLDLALNDVKTVTAQRDDSAALATDLRAQVSRVVTEHCTDRDRLQQAQQAAETERDRIAVERDGLAGQLRTADAIAVDLRAQIAALTRERDAAREQLARSETAHGETATRAGTSAAERDGLAAQLQTAAAIEAELRAQITALTTERDTERTAHATTREARTLTEAARDQADALRKALGVDYANVGAMLGKVEQRLADAAAAMRDAVTDDLRWLIEHESDRARRAQASPEKLRSWVGQFYPGHEDRLRKVLRPSVRAWMVCIGHPEPVEHVLDLLVTEYVSQSQRQLRTVADESDPETLAFGLEKVLRRWEADRAETIANRVLKEVA
jgi:HK97 family phage portal protein